MATLTIEIDKERDLPALQEVLDKMGWPKSLTMSKTIGVTFETSKLKY